MLRDIGDVDEFDLKAFGIAVNTASRIESLNKWIGTHLLVSAETTAGLTDFLWRPMGHFVLEGLEDPLELFELICRLSSATPEQRWLAETFATALAAYRNQQFAQSLTLLENILMHVPEDGPTKFYLPYAAAYAQDAPLSDWSAVITAPKTGPVPAKSRPLPRIFAV